MKPFLAVIAFLPLSCRPAMPQIAAAPNPPAHVGADQQPPAYEVATIKPPGPNEFAPPLRVYIQVAFGIPPNITGRVIGPDWVNSAKYVIQGKPPESIRAAMQSMTPEQGREENRLMRQALLAERFKFKAHFETRELQVYHLTVAKEGSKLKEGTDASKPSMMVSASMIRGNSATMNMFANMLQNAPDLGGREIVDDTGLTGKYDFSLKWAPFSTGRAENPPPPDAETASLFTVIEEQLGLKLTVVKEPAQVLIIDHIERPTEN